MKRDKSKVVILYVGAVRISFITDYPLPDYFTVSVKGQDVLKTDRKGLKALVEIWR